MELIEKVREDLFAKFFMCALRLFELCLSQEVIPEAHHNVLRKTSCHAGQDGPRSDGKAEVSCNMASKVKHLAWHPTENFIVCAANNSLYMYHA